MRRGVSVWVWALLALGLAWAQGMDYRAQAVSAGLLARLQAMVQTASGEEKLLAWAKALKDRAEVSHRSQNYFKAAREAQAALYLYGAARGEPRFQAKPPRGPWGHGPGFGARGPLGVWGRGVDPRVQASRTLDRAEKELGYYRGQDPMVRDLIQEAKARLEKEPGRAWLLARAALALISAERGF